MKYSVETFQGDSREAQPHAEFLADFVRNGGLAGAPESDGDPYCWLQRMRWWWDENPFCHKETPRGYFLLGPGDEVVGFHGLIPFDYQLDGERIPGFISSIFCVSPEHRTGSMQLFMKVKTLARDFHIVDGGPTKEVAELLGRFGFQRGGQRNYYFYLKRPRLFRKPVPEGLTPICKPEDAGEIAEKKDGKIRPSLTKESLQWLCSVGSANRAFFGVNDHQGRLVAYAIGIYKRLPGGFMRCQIVDYYSRDEALCDVHELLSLVVRNPKRFQLASKTLVLVWGLENGANPPPQTIRKSRPSDVYFSGPKVGLEQKADKAVMPVEGDFFFF